MTSRHARTNNRFVQLALLGRRSLAVISSLVLLLGLVLPPAHIHLSSFPSGQRIPVVAHQHLVPHRTSVERDAVSLWDHDDDDHGVVRIVDQHWRVPARTDHSLNLSAALFEVWQAPAARVRAPFRPVVPTTSPPDPLPKSDSLPAPPLA